MKPDYTEFSYGFALTHEIANSDGPLPIAPHFPSLYEEGKSGDAGGADVALDRPGLPLFLQFKRSHRIASSAGVEWKAAQKAGLFLPRPYLRFTLMTDTKSDQHDLLLELDQGFNSVFYAAPRYHRRDDLNEAWRAKRVAEGSVFIRPKSIGELERGRHAVAFGAKWAKHALLCSKPREIQMSHHQALYESLSERVQAASEPIQEVQGQLFDAVIQAYKAGAERTYQRLARVRDQQASERRTRKPVDQGEDRLPPMEAVVQLPRRRTFETRLARQVDQALENRSGNHLRDAALEAQRLFGVQMAIIQPRA